MVAWLCHYGELFKFLFLTMVAGLYGLSAGEKGGKGGDCAAVVLESDGRDQPLQDLMLRAMSPCWHAMCGTHVIAA